MQFFPTFEFNLITVLFLFFAFMALINLLYTFIIYGRLAFFKEPAKLPDDQLPPVSIIIAARNESDNLYENLPYLLQQNYPEYEIVIINNQSIDDSAYLLNAFTQQFENIRVIEVNRSQHIKPGKKLPLTLGIKGAKYEHLLFIDADCKPTSNTWIKSMASNFVTGKDLILGYGPYTKEKGFLNRVIRFDTSWIAVSYFSMALAKLPYMGVGRNMAYTKTLFNSVNGFKSHYSLPSGDDDLFIQEAAKKRNYTINIDQHSYSYSAPHSTWSGWIRQKTRHYSTSNRYSRFKKIMLGVYPASLLFVLFSFIVLMFYADFRWLTLASFLFLTFLKWWIQGRCFIKLNENSFVKYLPLWDLFYTILMPVIYYSSDKKEVNKW